MNGPLDNKFGRDRIRMRKLITAALARAVERHRRVRTSTHIVSMEWHQYERLLNWQDEWENYLRQERNKLYDGNKHERREHVGKLTRTRRKAQSLRTNSSAGA